jgi:hypothetical protein
MYSTLYISAKEIKKGGKRKGKEKGVKYEFILIKCKKKFFFKE